MPPSAGAGPGDRDAGEALRARLTDRLGDAVESFGETHLSVLAFTADEVHKVHKPLDLGFADFRTARAREDDTARELILNRRIAPDVYLRVEHLPATSTDPAEPVLVMRRMPSGTSLAAALRDGRPVDDCVRAVAGVVAAFHGRAPRGPHIDAVATADSVRNMWVDEHAGLVAAAGGLVLPVDLGGLDARARHFLDGREALFAERITQGCIVDGHGDLLTEDVFCLDDGPRVLDCLQFDERLRWGDVLADLAFLAMDLEAHGSAQASQLLLDSYRLATGRAWPGSLLHFYVAYRAHIRAKVAVLRWGQGDAAAAERATRHLLQAADHLERAQVRLVLVGGLPGTGKTTLAAALAAQRGWEHLRSDVVRKDMLGLDPTASAAAAVGAGIYSQASTERVYEELLRRADAALRRGRSVILDATWGSEATRDRASALAVAASADLVMVETTAPAAEARRRIEARRSARTDASDATVEVYEAMAERWAPWDAIAVPTTEPIEDQLARITVPV